MIKQIPVERDQDGFWVHPDLPEWEEYTPAEEIKNWLSSQGVYVVIEKLENSDQEEAKTDYFDNEIYGCTKWQPSCNHPGAFIVTIHDTEDGPVCLWFVPDEEKKGTWVYE